MTNSEIRAKIDENNDKMTKALRQFILTDEVKKLLEENTKLREQCKHNFVNGMCEYCDMPEEFKND